jgi:YD repeat-containing protein
VGGTTYAVTDRSYDDSGRLECSAVRMNPAAFGALPASACTLSAYDPALGYDRIARTYYDSAGQRTLVVEGLGTPDQGVEVQYTYTANGEVMNVIDGNGNASRFDHDGHGRVDHLWFPNRAATGQVSYSDYEAYYYDSAGNRTAVRRRDGRNIIYNYDALDRVTSKIYPDGGATAVYYSYDLRDLQLSARFDSQSGEGIANAYDGFGRLTSTSTDMGGITRTLRYRYDPAGNRTRIAYPDAADPAGRSISRPVDERRGVNASGRPALRRMRAASAPAPRARAASPAGARNSSSAARSALRPAIRCRSGGR